MIKIWRFSDAPRDVQCLYVGEGSPDWVAEMPAELSHLSPELFSLTGVSELWTSVAVGASVICFGANGGQSAADLPKIS
jgi:hypothetical protein